MSDSLMSDHENVQGSNCFKSRAIPSEASVVPYDENLLDSARTQWQFGDWQSLAKLSKETLQHHPDRGKLALLAAVGRLQVGLDAEARQYIRLAQDWGVSNRFIGQVLIAGLHNSIGRAAALCNQQHRALQHFENAIGIGTPGGAKNLIAKARAKHELETMGLLPGSHGRLQELQALADLGKIDEESGQLRVSRMQPVSETHAYYIKLSQTYKDKPIPFLLIDSKSLPRSGLHYLKNTLSKLLGDHFSFCEWYQEPGCCKKMPCALNGFAQHAIETHQLRIRLAKSHDFDLQDPVYRTNSCLRRLVLVRAPLYILTSWFAIDQLDNHKDILAKNGINITKIWLTHEKEVLKSAYNLVNCNFKPPTIQELVGWLDIKCQYVVKFMNKWVVPILAEPGDYAQVVCYEDLNRYIESVVSEFKPFLPEVIAQTVDHAVNQAAKQFKTRNDPFYVPSENLSSYIRTNSSYFTEAAEKLGDLPAYRALIG